MQNSSERTYRVVKWGVVLLNLAVTTWYSVEYFKLCLGEYPNVGNTILSKTLLDVLSMLSGLVLGDALRRIVKSVGQQDGLLSNHKVVGSHLAMFTLYMVSCISKTIVIAKYLGHKNTDNYERSLVFYTVNIWFEFLTELILIVIINDFSKPVTNVIIRSEEEVYVGTVGSRTNSMLPRSVKGSFSIRPVSSPLSRSSLSVQN